MFVFWRERPNHYYIRYLTIYLRYVNHGISASTITYFALSLLRRCCYSCGKSQFLRLLFYREYFAGNSHSFWIGFRVGLIYLVRVGQRRLRYIDSFVHSTQTSWRVKIHILRVFDPGIPLSQWPVWTKQRNHFIHFLCGNNSDVLYSSETNSSASRTLDAFQREAILFYHCYV